MFLSVCALKQGENMVRVMMEKIEEEKNLTRVIRSSGFVRIVLVSYVL